MFSFLANNLATIIISIVLVGIVAGIVIGFIRKRRKGSPSCGCGCAGCPSSSMCHPAGGSPSGQAGH